MTARDWAEPQAVTDAKRLLAEYDEARAEWETLRESPRAANARLLENSNRLSDAKGALGPAMVRSLLAAYAEAGQRQVAQAVASVELAKSQYRAGMERAAEIAEKHAQKAKENLKRFNRNEPGHTVWITAESEALIIAQDIRARSEQEGAP